MLKLNAPLQKEQWQENKIEQTTKVFGWRKFLVDLKYLFLEQVLTLRTTWPFALLVSTVLPLFLVFGFARLGSGLKDTNSLIYIIAGSAVSSIAMEGLVNMSQRVAFMKREGRLIYYASLPIHKAAFIAALLFSRLFLVSLPGLILPLVVGPLLYNLNLNPSLFWLLFLFPLSGLALSGGGMLLGLLGNMELVGVVGNIIIFITILASPVFIPLAALPFPLQLLSFALPTTYIADALRHCLLGVIEPGFYLDILMLLLMSGVNLCGVNKFMHWRLE